METGLECVVSATGAGSELVVLEADKADGGQQDGQENATEEAPSIELENKNGNQNLI